MRYLSLTAVILVVCAVIGAEPSVEVPACPSVTLTADNLAVQVYTPDLEHGYYQSTRFDHGGIVGQLTWHGHTFFGELKGPHDPKKHDHAAGVCEEFGMDLPVGFDQADPNGGSFVKIGVGVLQRIGDKPYKFNQPYIMAEVPTWTVTHDERQITCSQTLTLGEWGYEFSKTIAITPENDGFAVIHSLTNTGTSTISTDHYSHNMIIIDGEKIGPTYSLVYPVAIQQEEERKTHTIAGQVMSFTDLASQKTTWALLTGLSADTNSVSVQQHTSKVALTIDHDIAPLKVCVYGEKTSLCPEHFALITVEPGATTTWTTTYRCSDLAE